MRIFYKKIRKEDFPDDCDKIWDYIKSKGYPVFDRSQLEDLYREFSEEEFSAGFMDPELYVLDQFVEWLSEKEI